MHPLIQSRRILVTAMQELLDLADQYASVYPQTDQTIAQRKYFVMEATRLGFRLVAVQKEIEDNDLD